VNGHHFAFCFARRLKCRERRRCPQASPSGCYHPPRPKMTSRSQSSQLNAVSFHAGYCRSRLFSHSLERMILTLKNEPCGKDSTGRQTKLEAGRTMASGYRPLATGKLLGFWNRDSPCTGAGRRESQGRMRRPLARAVAQLKKRRERSAPPARGRTSTFAPRRTARV